MAKRNIAPRSKESVTKRDLKGKESNFSFIPKNDISFNPNIKNIRLVTPRCYKKGSTIFRIWPMLDPESPSDSLLNGRLNNIDVAGLSGMSISEPVPCVNYAGVTDKVIKGLDKSLINPCSYVIAKSKEEDIEGVSFWKEPYVHMYLQCKQAYKTGKFGNAKTWNPEWNLLMNSSSEHSACVPAFKSSYFIVCSVLENGDEFNLEQETIKYRKEGKDITKNVPRNGIALGDLPSDPLVVLKISQSTGKKLLELCCRELNEYAGDPSIDPSVQFVYGDPTGKFNKEKGRVAGGLFFTLYNPEKVNIEKDTSFTGKTGSIVEYEVAVKKSHVFSNFTVKPSMNSEQVANVLDKHVYFWKESDEDPEDSYLLHVPGIEERCVMLAKAFKAVPGLLKLSWMGTPYLDFDSVKAILNNKTTVDMGANSVVDDSDDTDDIDDEEDVAPKTSKVKGKPAKKQKLADVLDEEEDEEEIEEEEDEEESEDEDEEVDEEDEEESEEEDEEESDDEDEEESDDEDEEVDEEESEEEDEEADEEESEDDEDAFDDEKPSVDVNAKLNESLSLAKSLARSKKRTAPPVPDLKKTKTAPPAATKPKDKVVAGKAKPKIKKK